MTGRPWTSLSTIRVRLMAALAAALLPVLLLGVLQSAIAFNRERANLRRDLSVAAERSAATARARVAAADILLQSLASGSVDIQCAERLTEVTQHVPGYANLIRFDRRGRVVCAAKPAPAQPAATHSWFRQLAAGRPATVVRDVEAPYAHEPAVLAAARATAPGGRFDGAFVAVILLQSLEPSVTDPILPARSEVALVDAAGHYISQTRPDAFTQLPADWRAKTRAHGSDFWYDRVATGQRRVFSAAPVVGESIYVVLSARSPGILSWARLNPLSGIVFPLLTFMLALVAVTMATDRVVIRWIAYLQRIAALYARGRFRVRPVQARRMPPEIRDLAETLEVMANAIIARDASLHESLAEKDALMREIHHRVKNNLQVISSLLNLQQRSLADPAARAAMSDTRQRITALALIYRALYQGPDLRRVDLRPFLEELTAQLVAGEGSHTPAVRTVLSVEALVIDPDRLAPLALFAVEAITNAQKHAFAERGGLLKVSFTVREDVAQLEICDDGKASDLAQVSAGVGRTLMSAFARQLRGRAEVTRNPQGGVTARLIFPNPIAEPDEAAPGKGNQAAA